MDDDFVVRERPRAAPRAKRARFAALAPLRAALWRNPGQMLSALVLLCAGAAILVNALMLQGRPHPSPLFKSAAKERLSRESRSGAPREQLREGVRERPALPPLRPVTLGPSGNASERQGDAIADVIRIGADPQRDGSRQLIAAQRALTKLNYGPLRADGVLGPGTRAAIERFEKDRGLPPTGELGARVAKALSAAAGIPVE